ncbi:MAG: AbrB/MazE/SpoVT family DNA-binding domain-containing protein [Candidatus Bathyarchaeia archaeon]
MAAYRSKVGPKGQIVIQKALRKRYEIREGNMIEQIPTEEGVLIRPIKGNALLRDLDKVARAVGETWPSGLTSVEAVREDRKKSA